MLAEPAFDNPLWLLFAVAMFGLFLGIGLVLATSIFRMIREYLERDDD